jgi:hypothetical protein
VGLTALLVTEPLRLAAGPDGPSGSGGQVAPAVLQVAGPGPGGAAMVIMRQAAPDGLDPGAAAEVALGGPAALAADPGGAGVPAGSTAAARPRPVRPQRGAGPAAVGAPSDEAPPAAAPADPEPEDPEDPGAPEAPQGRTAPPPTAACLSVTAELFADLAGAGGQACPACDGEWTPEDEAIAAAQGIALPGGLQLVLYDPADPNGAVWEWTSTADGRAWAEVAADLGGDCLAPPMVLELRPRAGWAACPLGGALEVTLTAPGPQRVAFPLWPGCPLPPATATVDPGALPAATPTPGTPEPPAAPSPGAPTTPGATAGPDPTATEAALEVRRGAGQRAAPWGGRSS